MVRPRVEGFVELAATGAEAKIWDDLVSMNPLADVYFRLAYARAYEAAGHGTAIALRVCAGGSYLVPVLLRRLGELPLARDTAGFDAVTPYGYGGVLPLQAGNPTPEEAAALFQSLHEWCAQRGVVSLLLRLHPLLRQQAWLSAAIEKVAGLVLRPFGSTIAIPLESWSESDMVHNRRYNLRRARRSLQVTWSHWGSGAEDAPGIEEALRIFGGIYQETMDRLEASSFYYFPLEHFAVLAAGLRENLGVAITWQGDDPVGAGIFLRGPCFAHYHLCGTTEVGRACGAQTLLVREGVEWARAAGCRYLHLGGGRGGDDSLLAFKRGFGGQVFEYSYLTMIADPAHYDLLVAARRAAKGEAPRRGFFPEYRA